MVKYVPERGDLIWINFDPQSGREIKKIRPALVISPSLYNKPSGMALVCAITSKTKNKMFEVPVMVGETKSAILCDQLRSLDYQTRKARFISKAPANVIKTVQAKILPLILDK